MGTIGERMKARMAELADAGDAVSAADLAKEAGVSVQSVYMLLDGSTKTAKAANLLAYARRLKVIPRWLESGVGPKLPNDNHEPGPPLRGKVPLISWTTAGMWAEVQDPFPPGEATEWVLTDKRVGPNAFALRVVGDSMEPRIPDGSKVIIDPGVQPAHGKIVLAKRTGDQSATLKQLWYDGATPFLRPLNGRYEVLSCPADTRIIGVATQVLLDLN
jgi:SOS-response transcriptional repressor LexA